MEGRKLEQTKGLLIWKCPFGVFKSQKKTNEIFLRISAQASKKRSNQKSILWELKQNPQISGIKYPNFFDLTSF